VEKRFAKGTVKDVRSATIPVFKLSKLALPR
jgi:hypothetical protein